jgi:hypothetical protein
MLINDNDLFVLATRESPAGERRTGHSHHGLAQRLPIADLSTTVDMFTLFSSNPASPDAFENYLLSFFEDEHDDWPR